MNITHRFAAFAALAILVAAISTSIAQPKALFAQASNPTAQQPGHDHDQPAPAADARPMMRGGQMPMPGMTASGTMMKDDGRVTALVKTMNDAKGDAKVTAMANLLTVLVEERTAMQARMADMQTHMAAMQTHMDTCPMMAHDAAPAR